MSTPGKIEPGQVWRDNDPRSKGTGEFTIVKVESGAVLEHLFGGRYRRDRNYASAYRHDSNRHIWIDVSRLLNHSNRKTGYTYLGRSR